MVRIALEARLGRFGRERHRRPRPGRHQEVPEMWLPVLRRRWQSATWHPSTQWHLRAGAAAADGGERSFHQDQPQWIVASSRDGQFVRRQRPCQREETKIEGLRDQPVLLGAGPEGTTQVADRLQLWLTGDESRSVAVGL